MDLFKDDGGFWPVRKARAAHDPPHRVVRPRRPPRRIVRGP